jgi:hypothetical protein
MAGARVLGKLELPSRRAAAAFYRQAFDPQAMGSTATSSAA